MHNFLILLKKDFLELKRSKKWIIFIVCFSFVSLISAITARLLPEILNTLFSMAEIEDSIFAYGISIADSYAQFISNCGEICFLLILIMFSTTLFKEKRNGTLYLLKTNGVSETKIVLSHFLSKLILITVSYLISIAVFILLNTILFKQYAGIRGFVSLSYVYLSLVFALSLGLFISSIIKKNSTGFIVAIIVYFILSILSIFPHIDIYNPLSTLTMANNAIVKVDYEIADFIINLIMTLVFSISLIVASIYIFKNKINNRK